MSPDVFGNRWEVLKCLQLLQTHRWQHGKAAQRIWILGFFTGNSHFEDELLCSESITNRLTVFDSWLMGLFAAQTAQQMWNNQKELYNLQPTVLYCSPDCFYEYESSTFRLRANPRSLIRFYSLHWLKWRGNLLTVSSCPQVRDSGSFSVPPPHPRSCIGLFAFRQSFVVFSCSNNRIGRLLMLIFRRFLRDIFGFVLLKRCHFHP